MKILEENGIPEIQNLKKAISEEDTEVLAKFLFDIDLTLTQQEIVRYIAFQKHKRICINAMTRYGKTLCVAVGICIYILLNEDKKIALIAPEQAQAGIIRTYLSEMIIKSKIMQQVVDIDSAGSGKYDRLKKEASRVRQTFKNGCEYRVFSANGDANRLMGFGVNGIVVKDEACLIESQAEAKISRMLGDNPDETMLIELANPWDRATRYYEDWISGRFKTFHVGWQLALKEGRTTQAFIDEQRSYLTPIEFTVLYDSDFPEEAEDSLFTLKSIQEAVNNDIEFSPDKRIISCDVADKGLDKTVIMWGYENNDMFKVEGIYSENKSENMQIVGKIMEIYQKYGADRIQVDTIGLGIGVVSRLKELFNGKSTTIIPCHYGEGVGGSGKSTKPTKYDSHRDRKPESERKRFLNRKAEQFFRLKDLLDDGRVVLPDDKKLQNELIAMKWELQSSGKIRILDPDSSPDFADALVYFIWNARNQVGWFMG